MILWKPSADRVKKSLLTKYQKYLHDLYGLSFSTYSALQDWSIHQQEQFWLSIWDFCGVKGEMNAHSLTDIMRTTYDFKKCTFFPKAHINFAENLLQRRDDEVAIVFWGEEQIKRSLTFKELYDKVSMYRQGLKDLGVKKGDRVGGYLPNMPEAVIAMLATTSLGAVWSSCSPDFGVSGVLDRFGQIEPKVLFTADQFLQRGITYSILEKIPEIQKGLPTLVATIVLPYDGKDVINPIPNITTLKDFLWNHVPEEIIFEHFSFNIPLYIMFSSGTTGVPKCIVHGAGGTLLQHMKEHQLHCDIKPGDRVFYFTTCGWMMWNWTVSALASGATLLLYDGSPFQKKLNILFDYAQAEKMTFFGVSAKFIDALRKIKLCPKDTHDLSTIRTITSTGSPLMDESFEYVYTHIKEDVHLASISGGTDIISCFVLGNPNGPVHKGEIQAKGLGMAMEVFDHTGQPTDGKGELVCTEPFPSKPLGFWNDEDGTKYHKAYFNRFPNIWCHGDFAEIKPSDGIVIYGRSDAVLNPGGVRIGTAEIYRPVEAIEEVVECLATGYERDGDMRIILFARLQDGTTLTTELKDKIRNQIRIHTSSYHVPSEIIQVLDIPRTKSGKILELAVRELIHGRPIKNLEALANPESLAYFEKLAI